MAAPTSAAPTPGEPQATPAPPAIRAVNAGHAVAFVAVWTTLGYLLPRDPNLYLLVGVPLTLAFQKLVRRRPIRELWVRGTAAFSLDRSGRILAAVLLVAPTVMLIQTLVSGQWVVAGWMAAAVAGAVPAAWALRQARRDDLRSWSRWVLLITAIGVATLSVLMVPQAAAAGWPGSAWLRVATIVEALVLYVPVQFFLEEVSFRGLLDTHVHEGAGERQWPSALLVSALWGLWHLPVAVTDLGLLATIGLMLVMHTLIGVPMSLAWRRSGNLMVPVIGHTLIDAFRNALMIGLG
jgi:membrane protease YdiL (CAAX protease family)